MIFEEVYTRGEAGERKKRENYEQYFLGPRSLFHIFLHDCFVLDSRLLYWESFRKREEYEKAGGESFGPENI